ncbi:fumarylacetoacetate hydrolase family protein [Psychrosphaera aquimarina]|uniref:Fumarylacetoacetate hydrolase family protein n=1 Tax=Psychrosphaera aquimarina TaxID=2044854 RepID=A0ABU3R0Q4_9GAMM|nr:MULTISPECIES: fumarylacetoacetate hydrolase family protein [Psychrosphaera]MDU0113000.1 fumarylacetoacetate hydrolase family protein [Psychrosphaera aquimarina]
MEQIYHHKDIQGKYLPFPAGKVVCIGQNYADHIAELNSVTRPEALFFIKPNSALCSVEPSFEIPKQAGPCHNELELAVLISKPLKKVTANKVQDAIWGYGLALDLTLRTVQSKLKQQGRPWELAKGFDGACPISPFINKSEITSPQNSDLVLTVNQQIRQNGNSKDMIRPINELIAQMSQHFTLMPGDVVLTGTPAGVGPLKNSDQLTLTISSGEKTWQFASVVR